MDRMKLRPAKRSVMSTGLGKGSLCACSGCECEYCTTERLSMKAADESIVRCFHVDAEGKEKEIEI